MSPPSKWVPFAVAAGGAIVTSLVLYFFLKEDSEKESEAEGGSGDKKTVNIDEISKTQVIGILKEVLESQEKMKTIMASLTDEIKKTNKFKLAEVYDRVVDIQPEDPLEKYGVTMHAFDMLLERYQSSKEVSDLIGKIMTAAPSSDRSKPTPTEKEVVEVHEFMLQEVQQLVEEKNKLPSDKKYDSRSLTIAAQAIVGAQVELKFNLTSDQIEAAVVAHGSTLSENPKFTRINQEMHLLMNQLMTER